MLIFVTIWDGLELMNAIIAAATGYSEEDLQLLKTVSGEPYLLAMCGEMRNIWQRLRPVRLSTKAFTTI